MYLTWHLNAMLPATFFFLQSDNLSEKWLYRDDDLNHHGMYVKCFGGHVVWNNNLAHP